jgi:curli biogenesis system outer membrane secretion channel CsgG
MRKLLSAIMLIMVTAIFTACSNGSSPSDAAKAFYKASNDKDYKEAEKYIAQEVFDYAESKGYSMKEGIDVFTHDGDMKNIKIISEEINGKQATVVVKVTFNSGGTETKELPMFLEDGVWKIGLER